MLCLTTFLVFLLVSMVQALPLTLRDVYDPPITSPDAQTVWIVGESRTVTWDISSLPTNLTSLGKLVLGFQANDSENLMLDHPLAINFKLTAAKVQIIVPNVPTRNDYIVVLFGDSGNASPQFTIRGLPSNTDTDTATTTTTATDTDTDTATAATTTTSSLNESTSHISSTTATPIASSTTSPSPPPTTTLRLSPTSFTTSTSTTASTSSSPTSTEIRPSSQASTSGVWRMQSLYLLRHYAIGLIIVILWDFF